MNPYTLNGLRTVQIPHYMQSVLLKGVNCYISVISYDYSIRKKMYSLSNFVMLRETDLMLSPQFSLAQLVVALMIRS
jgi:hypothetical protein